MRTLNVRLAAILLVISVVFGGGVYLLHGYQIKKNASMFLKQADIEEERAKKAAEEGNSWLKQKALKDVVRCLGWYVRLMPDEVEVRERLGMILAEWSEDVDAENRGRLFQQAFGLLEATVGMDPERNDARRQLVKMAMAMRRFQDAKDHLQGFLLKESPKNPELLEQLGQCQIRMGDYDAAMTSLRKAIECGPDQITAYAALAGLLRSRFSQPKEADGWMEKLVEANPKSSKAHFLRSRYLSAVGLHDEALQEVSKALQLAPDDLEVLWLAATCNQAKGEYDEARRCAARGIKLHPDAVVMYTILADIELRAGNRDEAVAALEQGLKATDRNAQILWGMANLLTDLGKLEEAEKNIKELRTTEYPRQLIDYLSARIEYVQGHWRNAKEGFEKVRGSLVMSNRAKQIDVWIGKCYGQLGNRDQQLKAYRRALSADPTFIPAKAAMTDAFLAAGQVNEALDEFRQLAVGGSVAPASAALYARMLLLKNMRLPPQNRDWKAVEDALNAAEKALPDSPQIPILRAEALLAQDRADDAEKLLREARDKDTKQPTFWRALTSLADRRGDWEQAEKLLREADELFGDTTERRTAWAQHLVRRHGKEATERLRKLAENTESFSDDQRLQLWSGLLSAAMQVNDTEQIDLFCRKIAEKQPNNVNIRYMLFERALRAADQPAMERALKEIEQVAGQGSYWLYGQAVLLYLSGKDEKDEKNRTATLQQAINLLAKAHELRGDWSRIPLMEAGVYDALGQPDRALENYRRAFGMGERNPNGVRRTVQLLMQTRQYAEADQMLRQLEREQPQLAPELSRAGAEVALQQGEYDRALEMAQKAASADSKNYLDHLWLGQMLGILGSRAKAMKQDQKAEELLGNAAKALRSAAELEPKLPQTWVALIRFYSIVGEVDKAEKATEEAKLNIPAKEAPLALAQCYEAMHKTEDAEKQYEAALEAAPQDIAVARVVANFYARTGKLQSSEALLQRIIDGKVQGENSDLVWAKRQLALIYAARGGYDNLQKAQKLLELAGSEASALEHRALAQVYAADPQRLKRDRALLLLENMLEDQTAIPSDQLKLANMYEAAGDWIKASNLYRSLVATYPKEPRYLVAFIEALLRHNEVSSVEMYLNRLVEIAPEWFVTLSLRADLLCAKNQPDIAFDLMKKFVDEADAQSKDRDTRLRLAADKLNRLGRRLTKPEQKPDADKFLDQAETWYRAYAKENPARNLLLAVFLGARGKTDEALELLEKSMNSSTPQDFSRACIMISQTKVTDEEQSHRLDRILEKAIKKFDRHLAILLSLAELRTRQTQYDEAESYYREVIEKNPKNAVAMNNLAVLLALQGVKLDESLKLVDKAIEIAGPLGAMLDSRASVYMARDEPEKAVADITAAVADSETPVRLFHQAQAYQQAGQFEAAKKAWEKALEKNLSPDMLQPLELPAFEKMHQSPQ